jgi:hypothetical protein
MRTLDVLGYHTTYAGLEIIEDASLTIFVEDWPEVRSRARAERRRKRGFPQRIKYTEKPRPDIYRLGNKLVMHPETAAQIRRQVETTYTQKVDQMIAQTMFGMNTP